MECRLNFILFSLNSWVFKYEFHFIAEWVILYFEDNKNFEDFFFNVWYWLFDSGVRGQFLFMPVCDQCSKKQFLCLSSIPPSHSLTVSRQTMAFNKFYVPFHLRRALVFCSPMCLIWMKNMVNIGHLLWCNNSLCHLSIRYALYIILRSQNLSDVQDVGIKCKKWQRGFCIF